MIKINFLFWSWAFIPAIISETNLSSEEPQHGFRTQVQPPDLPEAARRESCRRELMTFDSYRHLST
jgi:hypothetical protein